MLSMCFLQSSTKVDNFTRQLSYNNYYDDNTVMELSTHLDYFIMQQNVFIMESDMKMQGGFTAK